MPNWRSHRTIIEERGVSDAADQFRRKYNRFDEAFEALTWVLARKGGDVASVTKDVNAVDYHLYRQAGDPLARTPDIVVLFTCDDDEVNLIAINAEEAGYEED